MLEDYRELLRIDNEEGAIVVSESQYRRVMTFDTLYEQSAMFLMEPTSLTFEYTQAMLIALAFKMPQHVTLLGLGGGSLLRCLHHHFDSMAFRVVEIRRDVLEVAKQYFCLPQDMRIEYVIDDGVRAMMAAPSESTNMIFSDMFNSMGPEASQESADFLLDACRVLTQRGWLVINCHDLPSVTGVFMQQAMRLFKEVYWVALNSGNFVLFMGKETLGLPFDEIAFRTLSLEQDTGEKIYTHARRMHSLR